MPNLSPDTITVLVGIIGLFLALYPTLRTISKDKAADIQKNTEMGMQIKQILAAVDRMNDNTAALNEAQKRTDDRVDKLIERIVVVEQSSKQAHKRLDDQRLIGGINNG